jgi:glycosyltransferase involved in cell wall biosynthesis
VLASRRAAPRAAGIVVKSRNLREALPPNVDPARVWIVPDGVNLDRFGPRAAGECRADLGWDQGRRHVLFPGSATRPEKRFALAQAAVSLLGGDVELHVLSGVAHDAVATWLNAADAVLLTSAHEGSPNVVKEALACNTRVVSVDVGDVSEWISGLDGCAIADPSPPELAAALARVMELERPTRARDRVEELSLPRVAARMHEIYAEVAGGYPTASRAA